MSEALLIFSILALVIERWLEIWMNILKGWWGEPPQGQNAKQATFRLIALGLGVVSGILVAVPLDLNLFDIALGDQRVPNGHWVTGVVIGLGTGPTHEIVKYVEEKKNKGKAERRKAETDAKRFEEAP